MASLTSIRDAAAREMRAICPDLPRVEAFAGELSFDATKNRALPPGVSVLVTTLGAENDAGPDALDFAMVGAFALIILSRNVAGAEAREADALAIAEKLALALHGQRFALTDVEPALVDRLEPVRDTDLDNMGVCVWTVVWTQAFVFTPEENP